MQKPMPEFDQPWLAMHMIGVRVAPVPLEVGWPGFQQQEHNPRLRPKGRHGGTTPSRHLLGAVQGPRGQAQKQNKNPNIFLSPRLFSFFPCLSFFSFLQTTAGDGLKKKLFFVETITPFLFDTMGFCLRVCDQK